MEPGHRVRRGRIRRTFLRCEPGEEYIKLSGFGKQGLQMLQPFEKPGRAGRETISERVHGEMTILFLLAESLCTSETHRVPVRIKPRVLLVRDEKRG
jgi:hypothetical protein